MNKRSEEEGMQMSNKSAGTAFENEFSELLSGYGFWVHILQGNRNGQPFDVIAARNGRTFVFDCKDCQSDAFLLSRIEENQHNAMMLWSTTGNSQPMFAIRYAGGTYLVEHRVMMVKEAAGERGITEEQASVCGVPLVKWARHYGKEMTCK